MDCLGKSFQKRNGGMQAVPMDVAWDGDAGGSSRSKAPEQGRRDVEAVVPCPAEAATVGVRSINAIEQPIATDRAGSAKLDSGVVPAATPENQIVRWRRQGLLLCDVHRTPWGLRPVEHAVGSLLPP